MQIEVKQIRWITILAGLLLVVPCGDLTAQEPAPSDLEVRISALESKMAQTDTSAAPFCSSQPSLAQSENWGSKDGCPSIYANYEMTILRPYLSTAQRQQEWDNSYGVGHRFAIGYDGGEGLGIRVKDWFYNHGLTNTNTVNFHSANTHVDMDSVDLEATLSERLRNWDLLLSGGVRYGRASIVQTILPPFNQFTPELRTLFEGVGPTVSLAANRGCGCRGLYLFGNLQTSILFGSFDDSLGNPARSQSETALVLENQLGLGWTRNLGKTQLDLRSSWESQMWSNAALGDDVYGLVSDLGFGGPSVGMELRY